MDASTAPQLAEAIWQVRRTTACATILPTLVQATRVHGELALGVSSRSLALYRSAQARRHPRPRRALPDDVQASAAGHAAPLHCAPRKARWCNRTAEAIVSEILEKTPLDLASDIEVRN
ncbi:MAG: hypothetical protein R2911_30800 [Caldilineaceae bacterium]